MNLSDLEFLGFFEVAPFLLIVVVSVIGIGLAIYSYQPYQSIPFISKSSLIALRSLIFILLGIILLNPVFENTQTITQKPKLAILVDQSASVSISKGNWNGSEILPQLTRSINNQLNQDFELQWIGFDSDIYELNVNDSLLLSGSQTDIGQALSNIVSGYSPDQLVLISDGIVTRGRDPLFVGQSLGIPIHTLAIGDSTQFQDVVVSFVDHSSEMVTDTDYLVSVGVRNDGFKGSGSTITLIQNGNQIESREIIFQNETGIQQIDFSINSPTEGVQEYRIIVEPLDSEWTTENNEFNFSVSFIDNRLEILYLTYQFHPDVSIIKQILFEYPEISVTELTWKGTSFLQSEGLIDTNDYDLIVIHGVPSVNNTAEIERLRDLVSQHNTVVFMIPGSSTNVVYPSILSVTNGFLADGSAITWTQSQIEPESSQSGHPVLDLSTYNWSRSPLVTIPSNGLSAGPGSQSLLSSPQYSTIPAISSQRVGNVRSTVISFSGFGSFYLAGNDEDRDVFTNLMGNVISWSASDINQELFEISTTKSEYSTRESILFNARVLKEDGSPESSASVELEISTDSSGPRNYSLQNNGSGNYSLEVPGLTVGQFYYTGTAKRNDFEIGTMSGSFTVGNIQQELINTTRQDNILNQLSSLTGGVASVYTENDTFLKELLINSNSTTTQQKEIFNLFKSPVWFLLILMLVTSEWLIRRKHLLP